MEAADVLYGVTMGNDGVSQIVSRRLPLEAPDDLDRGGDAAVGQEQGLFELLPDRVVGRVERDRRDLLRERATAGTEVVDEAPEQPAPTFLGRRLVGARLAGEPDEHLGVVDHVAAGWNASRRSRGSRRDTTFEMPSLAMVTPYSTSAISIVRFWCVITMNCAWSR